MPGLRIHISAEAANRNLLIPSGVHDGEIEEFKIEKSKSSDGNNYVCYVKVINEPGYEGAVKRASWSEKYPEFMTEFWLALGMEKTPEGAIDIQLTDISELKGRKVRFTTTRGEYKGKPQDDIVGWMPIGS